MENKPVKRNYWWRFVLLFVLMSILPGCQAVDQTPDTGLSRVQDVTAQQAFSLIQENKGNLHFVILDVRTQGEFSGGHIEGAVNLDVSSPSFRDDIAGLNKDHTYLVYCLTGIRSRNAIRIMQESGITRIYNLENGIREWTSEGLPVVR